MLTTIQRASFPDGRRILMISDIHAHADGLRAILDQAGFSKDDLTISTTLLSLPDWRSEDFTLYTWEHLPLITALDAQSASDPGLARYIRWSDHAVELLEKGAEMSRVLYHGQPMEVPTRFLFSHNGVLSCTDATDYVLETRPGDRLHLVLRLSDRCYVKKNSVSGWYFGRYRLDEVKEP